MRKGKAKSRARRRGSLFPMNRPQNRNWTSLVRPGVSRESPNYGDTLFNSGLIMGTGLEWTLKVRQIN